MFFIKSVKIGVILKTDFIAVFFRSSALKEHCIKYLNPAVDYISPKGNACMLLK